MGHGREGGRDQQEMLCYILQNIFLILQDPTEEGVVPVMKRCKLDSLKRPAYEPAGSQNKKRPRVTQEDNNISVLLSSEEVEENLVSSQTMYLYSAYTCTFGHNCCCHMQGSARVPW